jgi:hypothetical protein
MKSLVSTVIAGGALAFASIGSAGTAGAAPSGPSSVDSTINSLKAQGYAVIVNRVGTAPLSECSVRNVRPGQTITRRDSGAPGAGSSIVTTVVSKTVYVDVAC